ncbi:MAG: hypothetical protein MZV63_13900 [Marinilabiliales bacterium]|nr:hypothetical protein [Marinilabiliales bacterium]
MTETITRSPSRRSWMTTLASFAKKKDYDAITINSEASGAEENAILKSPNNYDLNLMGCTGEFR